jgi:hypothetical protein
MHQQVRVMLAKPSSVADGSGAMAAVPVEIDPREVDEGALVRLLDLLAGEGFNLRFAGGCGIETGGEFVFSVDDDGNEDNATRAAALLADKGYRDVRVVEPFMCEVEDKKGALRDCLVKLASDGRRVDEVLVGTPSKGGQIPIQITTIRSVARRGDERKGQSRA